MLGNDLRVAVVLQFSIVVGPAEVESVLVAHGDVSEAAAIGVPDSIKGEALVCFCV